MHHPLSFLQMCHLQSRLIPSHINGTRSSVFTLLFLAMAFGPVFSQVSATQILEESIRFHDPNSAWDTKAIKISLTETRPGGTDRTTYLNLDLGQSIFELKQQRNDDLISYSFTKDSLQTEVNGTREISDDIRERLNISRDRAMMLRNYYSYLWLLPMKLKDPGTVLDDKVTETTYDGYPVYKLKVTYDEEVGHDTWYFYFDRKDYQMRGYQFFHDEMENDGEYITLSGLTKVAGLLLPSERRWFTNLDNTYLGADRISSVLN